MLRDFENLKITLLDLNEEMCNAWNKELIEYNYAVEENESYFPNVEIVNEDIVSWLQKNNDHLLGIVSPANSFGLMDGGYDGAIRNYFLNDYDFDVIPIVQEHLKEKFWGEQPVGSSTLIRLPVMGTYILHTPTMIRPSIIEDPRVVYHCTRSCILEALRTECTHIVIPAFGGCCGKVPFETIAEYMLAAISTFQYSPEIYNWHKVYHKHILNDLGLM